MLDSYRKISEMTASYIAEFDDYTLDDLEFIKGLNKIVLSQKISLKERKYKTDLSLNKNYKYAYDFLGSIKGTYADYLKNAWENNVFHFKSARIPSRANSSFNSETMKHEIVFPICHTIEDSYAITHEIVHDYNMDVYNNNITRSLLTESISICAEMLQEDYLASLSSPPNSHKNNMINNMIAIYYKAVSVDYQTEIIRKFLMEKEINNKNFSEITCIKNRRDARIVNEVFSEMIDNGELSFDSEQRYILGILIASLMHQNILKNPAKINDFIYLNEHINEMEIEDVFYMFDLSLISEDGNILKVEDLSLKVLEKAYIKEIKRRGL